MHININTYTCIYILLIYIGMRAQLCLFIYNLHFIDDSASCLQSLAQHCSATTTERDGERSSKISFNEFMDTFRGEDDMLMTVPILSTTIEMQYKISDGAPS